MQGGVGKSLSGRTSHPLGPSRQAFIRCELKRERITMQRAFLFLDNFFSRAPAKRRKKVWRQRRVRHPVYFPKYLQKHFLFLSRPISENNASWRRGRPTGFRGRGWCLNHGICGGAERIVEALRIILHAVLRNLYFKSK